MSDGGGQAVRWEPARPKLRPLRLVIAWLVGAAALLVSASIVPGVSIESFGGALVVALVIAIFNALLPPLVAALRLPLMLVVGFLLVLFLDAAMLVLADAVLDRAISVSSFWWALVAALVTSMVSIALHVVLGTNDDDEYSLRVTQRIARRTGGVTSTDVPGIVFLEIDGLALPVLKRAMRDGNAPNMARWMADGAYRMVEWET